MNTIRRVLRRCLPPALAAGLALGCGAAQAQIEWPGPWVRDATVLRLGYETLSLPGNQKLGLVGSTYMVDVGKSACVGLGPAVYGAASGQYGGLFVVGAEAAVCTNLTRRISLQGGLFVGGGGGGGAPVGGGLMLRPHVDLLWDFRVFSAGVSYSKVRFPSGQIDSNQFGVVIEVIDDFAYLPPGSAAKPFTGRGRTGAGFDRFVGVVGAYAPASGIDGNSGRPLQSRIGYVGARGESFLAPDLYLGIETNGAASGGAAGYAEVLGVLGVEKAWPEQRVSLGARVALGMGGGGDIPVGGGLLAKAAVDAGVRLSPDFRLNLEAGYAIAPQGSFRAPFANLALVWDLSTVPGQPARVVREEFAGGVEIYQQAARNVGPPQSLQNVSFKFNRFVGDTLYLSAQVQSAYAGNAGAFAVGLVGAGAQWPLAEPLLAGAELLVGAAGGGGVDTGNGAVVKPMVYGGVRLAPSLYLRAGAGRIKALSGGGLDSNVFELSLVYDFGVAARP